MVKAGLLCTSICRPPVGCPLRPKNSYWKLLKTLYGLKRSPRHWYEMAKTILKNLGFRQSKHSPCIFVGQLIPHQPPLYLGLYVDDFIFFSKFDSRTEIHETILRTNHMYLHNLICMTKR
mmetsp:Transcript_9510/g.13480  ORF Transcript_9510/g.13480 Transcript_9510/m.13480 type:complete len:120 (-) Transcript_9510:508-867(-)